MNTTTKIEVVTSISGDIVDKVSELDYLRMMAMNHLKWH